jgi:putative DNA primase/helicase
MKEFAKECLANDPDDYVVKADVTTIYEEYAQDEDYELGSNTHDNLHQALRGSHALDYSQSYPSNPDYSDTSLPLRGWEGRKYVVDRMTLTEKGLEYAEAAGLVVDDDDTDGESVRYITDCDAGMHQGPVKATVAEKIDPPEWLEGKGHLVDGDGGIMPYVVEAGSALAGVNEGDEIRLENVKVENRDGVLTAVLSGITDVSEATDLDETTAIDDSQQSLEATADGGEIEDLRGQILEALKDEYRGQSVDVPELAGFIEDDPEAVKEKLENKLTPDGDVRYTGDGYTLNT